MAFDVGTVRIGVAASDPEGILASPIVTLQRDDSAKLNLEIRALLDSYQPLEVFVGLPKNLKDNFTASTNDAIAFARSLKDFGVTKIWLVDERLTTVSAARNLKSAGRNSRTMKMILDQQAACLILESALNLERNQRAPGVAIEEF